MKSPSHTSLVTVLGCAALSFAFVTASPRNASAEGAPPLPWWPTLPASAPTMGAATCAKPQGLPHVRREGSLVVESPPRNKPERWLRLRTHTSPPDASGTSYWEGPEVPSFVPLALGTMQLDLLDPIPGGYLAFYRSKSVSTGPNDSYQARLISCSGQTLADVPLNPLLSRRDQLEVQDIRYADGTLYFNEACQSYSSQAGGRCSALVAVDAASRRLLWRTRSLVSNSVIRVEAKHVIVGYGFTGEKDWVRVVRRSDGHVVETKPLPSSHFELEVRGNVLDVEVGGKWASFRMDAFDTASPRLSSLGTRSSPSATPAGSAPAAAPISAWTPPPAFTALPWFGPPRATAPALVAPAGTWPMPALPALAALRPWTGGLVK